MRPVRRATDIGGSPDGFDPPVASESKMSFLAPAQFSRFATVAAAVAIGGVALAAASAPAAAQGNPYCYYPYYNPYYCSYAYATPYAYAYPYYGGYPYYGYGYGYGYGYPYG